MKNSKKLVNLISLVVLVATNVFSPLSYATAGEEDIGSVSDTVSYGAEQGSGGESPAEASEGSDNNEPSGTEGRNLGDAEEDTQDSSATPQNDEGDVDNPSEPHPTPLLIGEGSPDEIGTGEVDNETPMDSSADKSSSGGQDEVDNGTGEKSAIDELKELIENEENSIQIVESEEIYGTGEYEGVKVEVYAQTGAFPLGTILNIIPITGDDEMRDIQDVLEEQKNVEKSQKVIAFDITFLSPETEEELQPSITGSVQVTFNYEENDELVAAEEDEEQDIQIFHINDKDENGERIKNITGNIVEDVVVNKEATEKIENTVVINAESFSIYAIVNGNENPELVATLVGDDNTRNNFKYRTITISDGTTTYTIMDRNLGAKEVWDGTRGLTTDDSYGYYYSWGKNYGHITAPSSSNNFTPSDVPSWDSVCPNGWKPLTERYSIYNVRKNSNSETDLGSEEKNFMYDLRIPPAGILEYNWGFKFSGRGSRAYFIKNDDGRDTFYYYISDSEHGSSDINHWNALSPIRCIKNSANSIFNVTFDSNGGSDVEGQVITQGSLIIEPEEPTKDGYTFAGWYTSDDGGQTLSDAFNFDTLITADITLYAKWTKDCGEGEVYFEEEDACATRDANNIVYYWNDGYTDVISVVIDGTVLTMMDKNLGASVAGTSSSSYGELYQRGNNAPVKTATAVKDERAEYKNYWPGHSFSDATFRYGSSMDDYWQSDNNTNYDNLWGGSGDDKSGNNWGGINNGDLRQGPCPAGYHVPSIQEWETVLKHFAASVGQSLIGGYDSLHYFANGENRNKFQKTFLLPNAGSRSYSSADLMEPGSDGGYWSSSPYGSNRPNYAMELSFINAYVMVTYNGRARGLSVRCFKDHPDAPAITTITFNENGGDILGATGTDGQGTLIQKVVSGKKAQAPIGVTKDGAIFQGWTTDQAGMNEFSFSTVVTSSMDLYAQWESLCPEGEEYVEDKCIPSRAIIRDSVSGEIIQINDMEWDDLELYFLKSDGTTGHYTIMDRNMGATEVYNQNQDNPNFESLGYQYQWGNNYGFKPCEGNECSTFPGGETAGNIVIEKSVWEAYAPSKYARNTWSTAENWMGGAGDDDNLRGGAGDDQYTDGPGTGLDRQGPCPDEYHIPSAYEWAQMSNVWEDSTSLEYSFTKKVIFDSDFLLSFAGYRNFSDGKIDNRFISMYRTSSPYSNRDARKLNVNPTPGVYNYDRSDGLLVRCMRNTNKSETLRIHANGGTNAVIAFTGSVSNGRFTSLGTPKNGNAVFLGWYDAPVDGNKLVTGSSVVPDIYARWVGSVTFNSNGGSGVPSQMIDFGEYATQPTDPTRDNSEFKWWYLEDPLTAFDFEHTAITGNITLNAKWECNEGYIKKGNSCVKSVIVTFNSKGGTPKQSVEIEKGTTLKGITTKYSHTSNIDDEGNNNDRYYDDNLDTYDIITLTGSENLYINLKYATETNYDYLLVTEGEYTDSSKEPTFTYYGFHGDSDDTLNTTGFYISGDTVTFFFHSDSSSSYYGYYAAVQGTYDKIGANPTNENGEFIGWHLSGSDTLFDLENTKITENTMLYAKWDCNSGYTEVDGKCVQQFTVEFEAFTNGGLVNMSGNLVASGSIKVASGTEINLSDYAAVNDPTSYIGDGWVFDGWGTIPERNFKIETPTIVITGDITLHALFYKIYESYFELQDINAGTLSSNTGYCTGYNGETSCDLIIPTFIENDGYVFDGFSNSQGSTGTIDIYTIGNTYYTVTHETTPISVTFNVNGNSGTTETRECYKYNGSDICLIKSPDITPAIGFTKIGWSTDVGTHTNEWNVNTLSGVSANSTYYAQSKKDKVTLNISYGTGVGVSSISKISDSCDLAEVWNGISQATSCTVTAPDITLKSGYGTGVWTKDTNPSVIKNPGDDIELTSNDSYTASAIATVYPISYHENGGTLVGQKTSYTVEEDFTLVTPNRDSYVFEGWTGSNGDNPQKTVTVNSGTVTGPLNYYANWTPITYTIAFNGNAVNVEGTQSSMDATYDSGDTAPESNFTRPGYTFTSWNTEPDGNGIEYSTGSELMNLSTVSGDVVTLYAIWQANTDTPYTVYHYLENINDTGYTLESTDTTRVGITDSTGFVDELKKGITGAHFEKASLVANPQSTDEIDRFTIGGDGNTEVYLFYKRNTHTVTATAGEGVGSVSGAGTYKYGQTVTLTPGNINSCYTASSRIFTMPDNDVQETLNGVIKKFTVTLNKDSHISSVQGAGEYNCGVEVNVSATPNVGYEFVRWEKNSTQVSTQSSYTFTITESVVLNAVSKAQNGITYTVRHWIRDIGANTYTKYSEESKSGETDSPITLENEKISVPCGTYAEGKENGTVKTTTTIKGDGSTVIDLYYGRNSYTVTTSKDSGIQSISNSASHECGADVTITATPKTGYSFARWNSEDVASSTSNPYTFTMPDKAVSIQAQSNANTYAVNFNANGGIGTMSQQTFTYDISQQLSDNLFTRTGYIFTGWSIDSGATVPTYTNKQSVDNLATTGSITLYAIWTTKGTSTKYTVRHIKQGLSTPTDDVVETQELYAETNSVQTPAVNIYSGFNSPSAGNITVLANGNASIDYVYTRKNITLTLDKDNGTQNSTITGKYGANVQKPTSNPSKSGYTFAGWLPNIPDTFPVINGTHVAQYTLDTYTITYNLNGGINHADNPTSYTYLSGDITLKAPTRDGYVFNGWVGTDVNSVTKTVIISSHSEGNRSYTAIWGEDRNNNGVDDDSEPKYTVTINYVYSRGGTVAGSYTIGNQLSGFTYNVDSPIITNYHADKTNVSGTITGNVEVTVTYTPDHDTNNNGIADEEETTNNSGGSSGGTSSGGGGGGGGKKMPTTDIHGSANDKDSPQGDEGKDLDASDDLSKDENNKATTSNTSSLDSSISNSVPSINGKSTGTSYTKEQKDAYSFAKSNGITTTKSIETAKMDTELTRIQMAKMVSNYAINVLGQEPDTSKGIVKFKDVTSKMNNQYDDAVTKVYQLGIMGQNMRNNKFRPNDTVTRAEFATALSRLLYHTEEGKYKGTGKYYTPHIAKLYNEGIISKTDPKMKEKRGYVMLMLMRSSK